MNLADLERALGARDRRAIARVISAVENETADAAAIRAALAERLGHARVLGITGPPGAGKSTLVNALIKEFLARGKHVAVVAVDPSSPITGGALLGDRIRMSEHHADERVYIRSLASRGHLGGLSRTTGAVIDVLDAARFDVVIVETVGAGQADVEIAEVADTRLVVCPPGLGDDVQAIKAGVLEIADVFVVNKADLPLAERAERELLGMLSFRKPSPWKPPVLRTVATTGEGVAAVVEAIERHQATGPGRRARGAGAIDYRAADTAPSPRNSHLSVRPAWLALHQEEIIEPGLPIVDAHHHLWDHPGSRYFLLDLLEDIAAGHNIRATVSVECGAMYRREAAAELRAVGETEFLNGAAAMSASAGYGECRVCAGIVGHADLRLGKGARPVLEAHIGAGGGRFRGVRFSSVWHPDPAARGSLANPPPYLLSDPKFREGFAQLAPLGLSFDAWMYHTQLPELVELARAFPETVIVLNHAGGAIGIGPYAGKRNAVLAEWGASMRQLARCPNLFVKLGGLGMRLFGFDFSSRQRPPSSEELAECWQPYIEACIEAFGAERCMFESNFPVDKGSCSYAVLWNAFKRVAAHASKAEKQALFSATASKVYRLS